MSGNKEEALRTLKELKVVLARGMIKDPVGARLIRDIRSGGFELNIALELSLVPPPGGSKNIREMESAIRKAITTAAEESEEVQAVYEWARERGIKLSCELQISAEALKTAAAPAAPPRESRHPRKLVENGEILPRAFTKKDARQLKRIHVIL